MRNPQKKYVYESYSDFLDASLPKSESCWISNARYSDNWAGKDAVTLSGAIILATKGWTAGRTEVRAITDNLNVAGKVNRQVITYDVTGDCLDVGRLVTGEPECMMSFTSIEDTNEQGNIIKLVVNTATSAGISEAIMRRRGAIVLSLIEALEIVGKRLEVWALFSESNGYDMRVCVKRSDETAQDDMLAFAIAHPSFSRRFCHAILGHGISPGNPEGIESESDIYFPSLHLNDKQWQSDSAAMAWLVSLLGKYGVTLDLR